MTLPRISSTGVPRLQVLYTPRMPILQLDVPWLDSSSPLADATKPNVFLGEWYDWDKEKLKPSCALCINNGCCSAVIHITSSVKSEKTHRCDSEDIF